jgi:hypothetical protein
MKMIRFTRQSISFGMPLVLICFMVTLGGCGNTQGLFTTQQEANLIEVLQTKGISVDHITNVFSTRPPRQGFILNVREIPSGPKPYDVIVDSVIAPIISNFLEGKNLRYQFAQVEIMTGLGSTSFAIELAAAGKSNEDPLQPKHYEKANLSFDYPRDWQFWNKAEFKRMQDYMQSAGVELIAMFAPSEQSIICVQIARSANPSAFETLYNDKKSIAEQVTSEGIEIMGERYVKYTVTAVDLQMGQKAVLGEAQKPNQQTGISYQMLFGGHEYDVNFIYANPETALKHKECREKVMSSLRFIASK